MKPFIINRNSWHYKLNVKLFASNEYLWERDHKDFCNYWRATVLKLIFLVILGSFLLFLAIAAVYNSYLYPVEALTVIGSILLAVIVLVAILVAVMINEDRKLRKAEELKDKPESLVVQKYRAYKSKICPMVEYDE